MTADKATKSPKGVYRKYLVKRLRDREGKHRRCEYFVLDLDHDPHAAAALLAYANSCDEEHPELAADLRSRIVVHHSGVPMIAPRGMWKNPVARNG